MAVGRDTRTLGRGNGFASLACRSHDCRYRRQGCCPTFVDLVGTHGLDTTIGTIAAQAQVQSLNTLLQLERNSLEERLETLLQLVEDSIAQIQVPKDLQHYIARDKKERPGTSHLGEDDDGGIASASATLHIHVRDNDDDNDDNESSFRHDNGPSPHGDDNGFKAIISIVRPPKRFNVLCRTF